MKVQCVLALVVLVGLVSVANTIPSQLNGIVGTLVNTGSGIQQKYAETRLIEHPASGKCMNIQGELIGSGIKIIMYDCFWRGWLTAENELFFAIEAHGATMLKGSASNSNMCMYTGNNPADPLYTIDCNVDDNRQQFEFRSAGGDEYQIVQKSTGRCLRAEGHENFASIRAQNCDENDRDQKWRICNAERRC